MRITELLEGKKFNDLDFLKDEAGKKEINFDLPDDLSHYMHNNDSIYREHVYPIIAKCIHLVKHNKDTKPEMFADAAQHAYSSYISEYPIRQLPDQLDRSLLEKVCNKLHDDFHAHLTNGLYKE